jgi:hypothetical protein
VAYNICLDIEVYISRQVSDYRRAAQSGERKQVLRWMNLAQVCYWFITVNVVEFKRIADGDAVWSMPESTISNDGYPIVHGDKIREEDRERLTRLLE